MSALIGAVMLEDGTAHHVITAQANELRERQGILRKALAGLDVQSHEKSTHAWLHLPEPWRGASFAQLARQSGVAVLPTDSFSFGREMLAPAVRINVGAARSRADLRRALSILVELINGGQLSVPERI